MDDIKVGSNRSFGIVFFVVFLLVSLYPLINGENVRFWSLAISFIFSVLGILNSNLLSPLNNFCFKFLILFGRIISPIVMCIIFFLVVTPIAFIMRLLGKDLLNLKYSDNQSYWIEKTNPKSKMKNQF